MMNFDFGLDVGAVAIAVVGAAISFYIRRRLKKEDRDRESAASGHAMEMQIKKDRAELATLHSEITSPEASSALESELTPQSRQYLTGLQERVRARLDGLLEEIESGVDRRSDEPSDQLTAGIDRRLSVISELLAGRTVGVAQATSVDGVTSRDLTKYNWGGREEKEGKYGIIALIGARFASDRKITSLSDFQRQFGAEVAKALEMRESDIVSDLLVDQVNHSEQRERYVPRDKKWFAMYGHEGVIRLDGKDYRTGWNLGVKGGKPAQRQLLVIDHFKQEGYPIEKVETTGSLSAGRG